MFICNVTPLIFIGCCYKYQPSICIHIFYHANQFSSKIVRTNGFNGSSLVEEVHSIIYCSSKDLKAYFVRRKTCPNFQSYRIKIEDDSNFINSMLHWIDPFSSTQRRRIDTPWIRGGLYKICNTYTTMKSTTTRGHFQITQIKRKSMIPSKGRALTRGGGLFGFMIVKIINM